MRMSSRDAENNRNVHPKALLPMRNHANPLALQFQTENFIYMNVQVYLTLLSWFVGGELRVPNPGPPMAVTKQMLRYYKPPLL